MASMGTRGPSVGTKDIALTQNSIDALMHRSRRRFRKLKRTHDAEFTLFPERMLLRVTGPHVTIEAVEREVDALNSMLVPVSRSLWEELMKTRSDPGRSQNHTQQLEAICGCRIHIERDQHAVRFFGRLEDVLVGIDTLDALARQLSMPDRDKTAVEADIVRHRIRARDLIRACDSNHQMGPVANASSSSSAGTRSLSAGESWQNLGTSSRLTCGDAGFLSRSQSAGNWMPAQDCQCPQASTVLEREMLHSFAEDVAPVASTDLTLIARFSF